VSVVTSGGGVKRESGRKEMEGLVLTSVRYFCCVRIWSYLSSLASRRVMSWLNTAKSGVPLWNLGHFGPGDIWVFGRDVAADGAAFEEDEAAVVLYMRSIIQVTRWRWGRPQPGTCLVCVVLLWVPEICWWWWQHLRLTCLASGAKEVVNTIVSPWDAVDSGVLTRTRQPHV